MSAGLGKKVEEYSGLMGILLPTFPLTSGNQYMGTDLPERLDANADSGYASLHLWDAITASRADLTAAVDGAFDRRVTDADKIRNLSITQMRRNTCD